MKYNGGYWQLVTVHLFKFLYYFLNISKKEILLKIVRIVEMP